MLKCLNVGILEYWNTGRVEYWKSGILEEWNDLIVKTFFYKQRTIILYSNIPSFQF